ncbi:hypothetical protein BJF78_17190 [Pseudonocardia sp. CNS-139]|nr:hypothetical protein BJF78_17190 [Pseudonocardia sp. CNS-139]
MHEHEVSGRPGEIGAAGGGPDGGGRPGVPGRVPVRPRRRARGPRPVRPGVVPVGVRPAEAERPHVVRRARRAEPRPGGPRLLVRRRVAGPRPVPRLLAWLGVAVAAAAVVVGLGVLSGVATQARVAAEPVPPAVTAVTVGAEATVWEVAERVAPAAAGPELAAVAERIVTDNSLTTVRVHPGQVLRITAG